VNYEKLNAVMMRILENKFEIKIIPKIVEKEAKTGK